LLFHPLPLGWQVKEDECGAQKRRKMRKKKRKKMRKKKLDFHVPDKPLLKCVPKLVLKVENCVKPARAGELC
jgi:hypothetical protein